MLIQMSIVISIQRKEEEGNSLYRLHIDLSIYLSIIIELTFGN